MVRARDVLPYHWGIWCRVGDDPKPFVNTIEGVSWSEDGQHLWFMLGTHNFYKADPDEEVELVACDLPDFGLTYLERIKREHAELFAKRPVPVTQCLACNGRGKVPITSQRMETPLPEEKR